MYPAGNTAVLELHLFPPKYSLDKDIDRFKFSQIFALGELLTSSYIQRVGKPVCVNPEQRQGFW